MSGGIGSEILGSVILDLLESGSDGVRYEVLESVVSELLEFGEVRSGFQGSVVSELFEFGESELIETEGSAPILRKIMLVWL